MSRLQADLLLVVSALIWGTSFVAMKTGMDGIGPFLFVACRFFLSFVVVIPFAVREYVQHQRAANAVNGAVNNGSLFSGKSLLLLFALCGVFAPSVFCQQFGVVTTSVTNAGFLAGLCAIFVPLISWLLFRERPSMHVVIGSVMAVTGVWFLNHADFSRLNTGDFLMLLSAVFFALHAMVLGRLASTLRRPLLLMLVQYGSCSFIAFLCALIFEGIILDHLLLQAIIANGDSIAYAGIISGGIAYTFQAIAQQYTTASDAAIIMAAESVFAAIAGYIILQEQGLGVSGLFGCALILLAILLVELRDRKIFALLRRSG